MQAVSGPWIGLIGYAARIQAGANLLLAYVQLLPLFFFDPFHAAIAFVLVSAMMMAILFMKQLSNRQLLLSLALLSFAMLAFTMVSAFSNLASGVISGLILTTAWVIGGITGALYLRSRSYLEAVLVTLFALPQLMLLLFTAQARTEISLLGLGITVCASWFTTFGFRLLIGTVVSSSRRLLNQIDQAIQTERSASELESSRRWSARLLHDTVLSTLTLLAHSGVGVSEAELRHQAQEDKNLLVQLRHGLTPAPKNSANYKLTPVEETELGNTLEGVRGKFLRRGLNVQWHGDGRVLLPSQTLEALLLAISECLENVRRHSGSEDAHVTITSNEKAVKAFITDNGKGFSAEEIEADSLGFKESIKGRIEQIGGKVMVYSASGSGTTVVIEVPR